MAKKASDPVGELVEETITMGKQALVFVNAKRSAEAVAEDLAKRYPSQYPELAKKILKALGQPTKQCRRLAFCVEHGIAFHHAGLVAKQRHLVEEAFIKGELKVIAATPTLAAGVNTPAFRVIIRDLHRFDGYMKEIDVLDYMQMCFPAGTLVLTDQGNKAIETVLPGDVVYSFDETSKKYSQETVIQSTIREGSGLFNIQTKRGLEVQATKEHPFYVVRKEKAGWVYAQDLQEGDFIVVSTLATESQATISFRQMLPDQEVYVPAGDLLLQVKQKLGVSDKQLGALIGASKNNIYHYKTGNKNLRLDKAAQVAEIIHSTATFTTAKTAYGNALTLPSSLTPDICWLAGLVATDGTLTETIDKRTRSRYAKIRVANTNPLIIAQAKRILESITEGNVYLQQRDGCFQLEKGCTLLADILTQYFRIPQGKKSHTVRIPLILHGLKSELIGAYLAGVIDGDGSYCSGRVHICTASQDFAKGLQRLMLELGVVSTVRKEKAGQTRILKGKTVQFKPNTYAVIITKKQDIIQLAQYVKPVKVQFTESYSSYHNVRTAHERKEDYVFDVVTVVEPIHTTVPVYNLSVTGPNTYFANNILVHNCGRAGRPDYNDTYGEAITIAKTPSDAAWIEDRYWYGDPEPIYSKLASLPALRTAVLSLYATRFVKSRKELLEFFSKTFFAHQFKNMSKLNEKILDVEEQLEEWGFLHAEQATPLGRRVSQLYIDPYSAHTLLEGIQSKKPKTDAGIMHLVCSCIEMRPLLRLKAADFAQVNVESVLPEPSMFSAEYEEYMSAGKTANMLQLWLDEAAEEKILEAYDVRPGELRSKIDTGDWLLYSAVELCKLLNMERTPFLRARLRLKYGVKPELLALLRIRGVGRVRARKLYTAGLTSIQHVATASDAQLAKLVGPTTAFKIKEQLANKSGLSARKL